MDPFIGYNTYHHKFLSKSFSDSIKYKGIIMKDLQESNNMRFYSKVTLHMPFPAMISLLV